MTNVAADSIQCRLLCASGCAYGIDTNGNYTPPQPYSDGVGWLTDPAPVPIFGGTSNINACLVGANADDGIIVAFRGTLSPAVTLPSLLDWWQDIMGSAPESVTNIPGKVYSGLWGANQTIWSQLVAKIAEFQTKCPDVPVFMTGHSKGGPMATLAAAQIHFDQPGPLQPNEVFTFASPHPGDTDFVAGFPLTTIPVTRYENYLDIVPLLPPTEAFIELAEKIPLIGHLFKKAQGWNYASLGTLQYIKEDHKIIKDELGLMDVRLIELVAAMSEGLKGFGKIVDAHSHACGGGYMGGTCPSGVCP